MQTQSPLAPVHDIPANDDASPAPVLTLVPDTTPSGGFAVDAATLPVEGGTDPTYGEVTWRTLFCADRTATGEFVLGIATFGPGERLHPHRHEPAEFYYCTAGGGEITINGIVHAVHSGIAIYLPANAEHSVEAGPQGLSFLYGFAEARFADIEYRFSGT